MHKHRCGRMKTILLVELKQIIVFTNQTDGLNEEIIFTFQSARIVCALHDKEKYREQAILQHISREHHSSWGSNVVVLSRIKCAFSNLEWWTSKIVCADISWYNSFRINHVCSHMQSCWGRESFGPYSKIAPLTEFTNTRTHKHARALMHTSTHTFSTHSRCTVCKYGSTRLAGRWWIHFHKEIWIVYQKERWKVQMMNHTLLQSTTLMGVSFIESITKLVLEFWTETILFLFLGIPAPHLAGNRPWIHKVEHFSQESFQSLLSFNYNQFTLGQISSLNSALSAASRLKHPHAAHE